MSLRPAVHARSRRVLLHTRGIVQLKICGRRRGKCGGGGLGAQALQKATDELVHGVFHLLEGGTHSDVRVLLAHVVVGTHHLALVLAESLRAPMEDFVVARLLQHHSTQALDPAADGGGFAVHQEQVHRVRLGVLREFVANQAIPPVVQLGPAVQPQLALLRLHAVREGVHVAVVLPVRGDEAVGVHHVEVHPRGQRLARVLQLARELARQGGLARAARHDDGAEGGGRRGLGVTKHGAHEVALVVLAERLAQAPQRARVLLVELVLANLHCLLQLVLRRRVLSICSSPCVHVAGRNTRDVHTTSHGMIRVHCILWRIPIAA
mmetsp:Transcript_47056/g.89852  ORF Transcript_47056/g.89852 Transcript_47056/m.89852 type:complete len:322 (+) Transcript_47056:631-1596(+)